MYLFLMSSPVTHFISWSQLLPLLSQFVSNGIWFTVRTSLLQIKNSSCSLATSAFIHESFQVSRYLFNSTHYLQLPKSLFFKYFVSLITNLCNNIFVMFKWLSLPYHYNLLNLLPSISRVLLSVTYRICLFCIYDVSFYF